MNKTILASSLALALSTGAAQASLTINSVHDTATPNKIEAYYIQANTSGSSNIFLSSIDTNVDVGGEPLSLAMNGLLSVWQLSGSNWVLVGANDEAPETLPTQRTFMALTFISGPQPILWRHLRPGSNLKLDRRLNLFDFAIRHQQRPNVSIE